MACLRLANEDSRFTFLGGQFEELGGQFEELVDKLNLKRERFSSVWLPGEDSNLQPFVNSMCFGMSRVFQKREQTGEFWHLYGITVMLVTG